jgi:bifunctional UDP-N-acetylglucosamine pyrophosphorylase/glucosamine-1-phosphate N-acetyltransferase
LVVFRSVSGSEQLNLTVIILAAGQGKRMRSDLPKALHPLAGRPMVRYVLDVARTLEPAGLVAVVGHGANLVREALGAQVGYAVQAEQLGTGHAVQQARFLADKARTVLVIYSDTPLIRSETLHRALAQHETTGAAITILTFRPGDPVGYGRVVRDPISESIRSVVEDSGPTGEQQSINEVSSGVLFFRDEWLWPNLDRLQAHEDGESCLTDLVAVASEQGELVGALHLEDPLEAIGLDHRASLARAEAEMRRRINQRWMFAGVTLVDPGATYIDADVEIGTDTTIWPGSLLQGQTHIGPRCTIGPGAVIRDSTIGSDCRVELSVVEQAVMEDGSNIGPFGHLRKGAHLGAGAHMGNFGEVKNSYLGPGAKMGHFSYLGDATVGAGANIGAGTITCNYDGQRKHPTEIGEGAFIGSDTMLVAPVRVGKGAKTGAGSVVTRDVPAGEVAYGVPARIKPTSPGEEPEESWRDD